MAWPTPKPSASSVSSKLVHRAHHVAWKSIMDSLSPALDSMPLSCESEDIVVMVIVVVRVKAEVWPHSGLRIRHIPLSARNTYLAASRVCHVTLMIGTNTTTRAALVFERESLATSATQPFIPATTTSRTPPSRILEESSQTTYPSLTSPPHSHFNMSGRGKGGKVCQVVSRLPWPC